MDLHLDFVNGRMTGDGTDNIGLFLIKGSYQTASRECEWTKTYPGSHLVFYRGYREGNGIWGTWEIPPFGRGGFHIWPRRAIDGEQVEQKTEVDKPVTVQVTKVG